MPDGTVTSRGWGERQLQDALKYEGDTMQHCVGGYCEPVMSGATKVFSLRDAQGRPHVTIEAQPQFHPYNNEFNEYWTALDEATRARGEAPDRNRWYDRYLDDPDQFAAKAAELLGNKQDIVQIKGKQNAAPVSQYVPYVQDFIRSQDWGDIRELQHAGMVDAMRQPGRASNPPQRYMTQQEYDDYLLSLLRDEQGNGMKEGGEVKDDNGTLDALAEKYPKYGSVADAAFAGNYAPYRPGKSLMDVRLKDMTVPALLKEAPSLLLFPAALAAAFGKENLADTLSPKDFWGIAPDFDYTEWAKGLHEQAEDQRDEWLEFYGQPTLDDMGVLDAANYGAVEMMSQPGLIPVKAMQKLPKAAKYLSDFAEFITPISAQGLGARAFGGALGAGMYGLGARGDEEGPPMSWEDLQRMLAEYEQPAAMAGSPRFVSQVKEKTGSAINPEEKSRIANMVSRQMLGYADGGVVQSGAPSFDPERINALALELMEPQGLQDGGRPVRGGSKSKIITSLLRGAGDVPKGKLDDVEAGRIAGAVEDGRVLPVREGPLPAGMAQESVVVPGEVGYDIRFDPRVKEQEKIQSSVFRYQEPQAVEAPEISIFDLEGRPFILGMADRTDAGKYLTGINDIDFDIPVGLEGGQGFMFHNPGRGWAADKGPVSALLNAARRMDEDPLFLPFRMAPTGGDYAHMTAETMLAAARNNMSKKNIKAANSLIRQAIPEFKGIEDIQSIRQLSSASGDQRKAFLGIMDKEFRGKGGLNIGQARLAVSEPQQYQAPDLGLQNVGTIFRGQPRVTPSGHGTYAAAMPGGGLGVLKEKGISAFELLPELVRERGINIARPESTEMYTIRRGVRSGVMTEDILRQIEKRLAERLGLAPIGIAGAAGLAAEDDELDAMVDSVLEESAASGLSPQEVLLRRTAPAETKARGGLATYRSMIGA
jgi:hypothetical protein